MVTGGYQRETIVKFTERQDINYMKVFISQKFRNLTAAEVLRRREMLIELAKTESDNVEIIDSWHPGFDKNSVAQLGQSIIEMSGADLVMVSDVSFNNITEFVKTQKVENFKGSEFEALICASYNIHAKMYTINVDSNGSALSVEWA